MRNIVRAFFLLIPSIGMADGLPQKFPGDASEREKFLHCVAVEHSVKLASLVGAELVNQSGGRNGAYYGETATVSMLADWFVETLGGEQFVSEARNKALDWEENWRSSGRTYWMPMMGGTGTPYNVREGELLMSHQISCLDFVSSLSDQYSRSLYSNEKMTFSLPPKVTN